MSAVDTLADRAQLASQRLAGESGLKGKLAAELADDAVFLRKLKPSLMRRRMQGRAPTNEIPVGAPQHLATAKPKPASGGPTPFIVVGAALVAGIALAKWIDWRGHAHPRW
jgi:hypothetical protein